MALNPTGAISLAGPTAGQSIAVELGQSATAQISLNDTNVRTLAQVPSGAIIMPTNFWGKAIVTGTQKAIFGFGATPSPITTRNITNLVSNTGVFATDVSGIGTARFNLAAASYGGDKAIFGYGATAPAATTVASMTNLVSNTGVLAADTPGVGTARQRLAAAAYGGDKAIFGFGAVAPPTVPLRQNITNLVSNTGVVAANTPGVGTVRDQLAATGYGGDKAIFGFGFSTASTNVTNLVSNTGVVATDTPGVGTAKQSNAACKYGADKALFAYGVTPAPAITYFNSVNLISNTGVVSTDSTGAGTARSNLGASNYGGDKGVFGYGTVSPISYTLSNLVSNTGVLATDTPIVGTARYGLAAAGYSTT